MGDSANAAKSGPDAGTASRLRENIVSMFVLQGANYALPLITIPYLVRVLGPADYGRMNFAMALIAYFSTLVDYGFNLSATRQVALLREKPDELSRFVSSVMTIKIVLAALGFLIVYGMTVYLPRFAENQALYLLTYVTVAGTVVFPLWLYRGLEAIKLMSMLTIAGRAISVCGIFIFVHSQKDLLAAALAQSSSMVFAGIAALVMLPRFTKISFAAPDLHQIWQTLADGWHAFLSSSAITLYTSSNIFVLGLMTNPVEVGYYSAANKIILAAGGLVSSASQAIYPHVVGLIAKSSDKAIEFLRKLFWVQGGVTFALSLFIFIFSGIIVHILLGPKFAPCIILVRIMAFLPLIIGVNNVFGIQTMMAFNMKKAFSRIVISSSLLNIIILVPLVLYAGAAGAAWAVLLIEILVTGAQMATLYKKGILQRIVSPRNVVAVS